MSMAIVAVSAVALQATTSYFTNQAAGRAQKRAQNQAAEQAKAAADQADQDFNKANRKTPDTMGLLSANQQASRGGVSGTMLTGSGGVDPGSLLLGKNTLLGL